MKLSIPFECPHCKKEFSINVESMHPGNSSQCGFCGAKIEFTGDDGAKAQKALDSLLKTLKNLSK